MSNPVIAGPCGIAKQEEMPAFRPQDEGPFPVFQRHYPAALRLLGLLTVEGLPHMTADRAYRSVRAIPQRLWEYEAKTPDEKAWMEWLSRPRGLYTWWKSPYAWRAPREFASYQQLEARLRVPHLEPVEFAEFQLPEDIAMDADVVLFQGWCQGVVRDWMRRVAEKRPEWSERRAALMRGLAKAHQSPWIRLSLAAPHMQPVGVLFPGVDYLTSCERLEHLLEHPYGATVGEMHHIQASPCFQAAYERARIVRRRGSYVNPTGGWYACGLRHPLGGRMRKSGVWVGKRNAV